MDSLTIQILQSYFETVLTLEGYLRKLTGKNAAASFLTHETDTLSYRKLLHESVVVSRRGIFADKTLEPKSPLGYLPEIIDRAQTSILRAKKIQKNVLTSGYRMPRKKEVARNASGSSLVNYAVNTTITCFHLQEWDTLYNRVGEDIMFHLLAETTIFIALPNACFCQLTGEPIVDLKPPITVHKSCTYDFVSRDNQDKAKRKRTDDDYDEAPKKCRRTLDFVKAIDALPQNTAQSRSSSEIPIPRARLFYSNPHRRRTGGTVVCGLPPEHVLNRLREFHQLAAGGEHAGPDLRKQMENARHLSKYVFPLQYGLPCALTAETQTFSSSLPNYMDREEQIKKKGSIKTPKRLKSILSLLERTIWRHHKCGYRPLLQKICPSKLKSNHSGGSLDSSVILEMMSEDSFQLNSQALHPNHTVSFDSTGQPISAQGLSQSSKQAKKKPRFAEFTCSHAEVYCYAVLVTKLVIPPAFWGSKKNFAVVKSKIQTLISARRYETFTLHSILQNFSTSDCGWLMPDTPGARKQSRVSVTDSLKRTELLKEFLFWYFDSFLIPLIRTNFYVTESSAFRNKILYFRQDDWETLCTPLIEKLTTDTFQKLRREDAEEILHQRRLGYSFVRLLPKETGVRPIVNLRRKESTPKGGFGPYAQSINQIMKAAFHILTYEKEAQKKKLGASVFGPNEVYMKLKAYKTRLLSSSLSGKLPKLYFVKLDVQACFDTIEQTKLLQILRTILSEEEYLIQRHGQVGVAANKVKRTYVKMAMPADDHPHFLKMASKLAEALRHTIFVDQVLYPTAERKEILELLEQHITDNIVKIGNDYYRQVVGIPQGSILSTLLCSFFYGDLERTTLKFTEDTSSVLLRLIDDYLLVTTDLAQARKFLNVMNKGHAEYGCFISRDKTLTNFHDESMSDIVDPRQQAFPWCGYLIDMSDLSVSVDYSRFHSTYLQDSLTVDLGRRPGVTFTQKMLRLAKSRSHIIFTDSRLNSIQTVYKTIYQNFLLTAMKMHYYIRIWKLDLSRSSAFILSTVRQMIRYAYATMRVKALNKISKACGGQCEAQKAPVLWLGTHAFHTVLSRKSHAYCGILKSLEVDMNFSQYRRYKKRFKSLVREGRELLDTLSF